MLEKFEQWIDEVQQQAINTKKEKAKARSHGDENKWKEEIWRSPEKNKAIKEKFALEGLNLNYKPRPSLESKAGEWLYDFVWREFDKDNNFISVPLTMEIEMSSRKEGGLKYDFYKLLQADSYYKVFIFQNNNQAEVENHFKKLNNSIVNYESKSASKYLLAGWSMIENKFHFCRVESYNT